jgi:hypothetical protein
LAGLVFAIGGAAALACSSFGADGGGTPSATDAATDADATTTSDDAATTDAATTDAADGGPPTTNLLVNGDFENGCNSWVPFPSQASLSVVASGRDGGTACRVCTTQASTILLSLNQTPVHAPPPSSTYGAEVLVRGLTGTGPTTASTVGQTAYATLRARDDAGLTTDYAENGLPLVADWQSVKVKVGVGQANAVDFYVYIERDGGFPPQTCFDVDDATVFKIP